MTLRRDDFAAFFRALHDGHEPFAWQQRLLDELLEAGVWPGHVVAPTGAGKTAVIDVHVFAVALTAGLDRPRLPRRLAMVVARRVLVDDQYEHAERVAAALQDPRDETVAQVAARLRELRWPAGRADADGDDGSPLVVARLRGGAAPSRDWRDQPTACAVVCATPEMWGSRVLFRGYGTAPRARPREAGLLALDAAVVVDEAHLSPQLLTTARQVTRLASVADEPIPVPVLQVVETTATPAEDAAARVRSVGVTQQDVADEPVLARRLTTPKAVAVVSTKDWPASTVAQRRRAAILIADQATGLLTTPRTVADAAHTVGCYVNTVAMAIEVAKALRSRSWPDGTPLRVVMVCGQARPADLERLRRDHPGILSAAGNSDVDVLVSTQSLEVGVDLDLAGVVTELAAGSALVQRIGRVNRRGLRATAPVTVLGPAGRLTDRSRSGPYGPHELTAALEWVERRAADPAGMAPWAVQDDPPPQAARRRPLFQRPELADVWHWARTSDELAADPQLDLWLVEGFDDESSVGLVVRDALPADATAETLVRAIPPRDREVFTVPPGTARAVVADAVLASGVDGQERPLAVRVRGDDVALIQPENIDIRPGDVVVVDSRTVAFTPSDSGFAEGFSPPVPVGTGGDPVEALALATANDVLHDVLAPAGGQVVLRLEPSTWTATEAVTLILKEHAGLPENTSERARRDTLRRLLKRFATDLGKNSSRIAMVGAATDLLGQRVKDSDLILHRDEQGEPVRLILLDRRRAWADERLRQTWLPREEPILLDDHQNAVADRAAHVGEAVRLPRPLIDTLRAAGRHHDDGKADHRFQAGLGARDNLLAKSGGKPLAEFRRLTAQTALPNRWRHEQRSVVSSWTSVYKALPQPYAELAARLVGTSHGHGRTGFPHTAAELLSHDDSDTDRRLAEDLFDHGAWDTLTEATHHCWGVWGCAYMEALLRAADGQVSGEGR